MSKRIGIMTGGGDCPGLNAAIRAAAKAAFREGYEVVGIRDGWKGLIEGQHELLDDFKTSGIIDRGGTILGTSRVSPFYVENGTKLALDGFEKLGLQALVVLGGEGTLAATSRMSALGMPLIGIPKTIDNDVRETQFSIGFQTAVQIATDALDRLRSTAESHHRVMVLEVMGRRCGWIATYAGLANGADAILIPEIPLNDTRIEALCDVIRRRNEKGKRFSIVVVAEGVEFQGELAGENACNIADKSRPTCATVGDIIEKKTGLETRVTTLGYVQRGGTPVAYDRSLATAFGVKAIDFVGKGRFGVMTALRDSVIVGVPLAKVAGGIKTVNRSIYRVAEVFFS